MKDLKRENSIRRFRILEVMDLVLKINEFAREKKATVLLNFIGQQCGEEEILAGIHEDTDKETRRELKIQAKTEKQNYSKLKKAQGFNNKIKVAKRIGYGYRNEDYFFKLIRYLSLPSVRNSSPNFP